MSYINKYNKYNNYILLLYRMDYFQKYQKYKAKYLALRGGGITKFWLHAHTPSTGFFSPKGKSTWYTVKMDIPANTLLYIQCIKDKTVDYIPIMPDGKIQSLDNTSIPLSYSNDDKTFYINIYTKRAAVQPYEYNDTYTLYKSLDLNKDIIEIK